MIDQPILRCLQQFMAHSTPETIASRTIHYRYHKFVPPGMEMNDSAIIFIHGFKNNLFSFGDLIARLNRPSLALDLRGFGATSGPEMDYITMADYLADLHRLLTHCAITRTILIGHSLGSRIAAVYSSLFPNVVQGLVMIEGYYQLYNPGDWPLRFRSFLGQIDAATSSPMKVTPQRLDLFFQRQTPGLDPILSSFLANHSYESSNDLPMVADWDTWHQRPNPLPFTDAQMWEALHSLTIPTLVLQSDPLFAGATELLVENERIEIVRIKGGHQLHWANPMAVARAIDHWLADQKSIT